VTVLSSAVRGKSMGDHATATAQYRETASILDKSVQKGVLHRNTANRYKSRLNARVKAVAPNV
jgi:small subunit ribosomal protein S20